MCASLHSPDERRVETPFGFHVGGFRRAPKSSMAEYRPHSISKRSCERRSTFSVVQVANIAKMSQIERYVVFTLGYQDDLSSQCMRDSSFVKDVRIST